MPIRLYVAFAHKDGAAWVFPDQAPEKHRLYTNRQDASTYLHETIRPDGSRKRTGWMRHMQDIHPSVRMPRGGIKLNMSPSAGIPYEDVIVAFEDRKITGVACIFTKETNL